jgi:hypothetical protein
MSDWVGSETLGKVEALGDEAVYTEFYCFILPLWPVRSYYACDRRGVSAAPITLHTRSVVAGYLRATTWMAALLAGLPGLVDFTRWGHLLPAGAALAAVAAWLTWRFGRLGRDERTRREVLRRAVGFGAPPELLAPDFRQSILEELEGRWQRERGGASWADAILAGEASEVLAALADYHGKGALAARARANLAGDQAART